MWRVYWSGTTRRCEIHRKCCVDFCVAVKGEAPKAVLTRRMLLFPFHNHDHITCSVGLSCFCLCWPALVTTMNQLPRARLASAFPSSKPEPFISPVSFLLHAQKPIFGLRCTRLLKRIRYFAWETGCDRALHTAGHLACLPNKDALRSHQHCGLPFPLKAFPAD